MARPSKRTELLLAAVALVRRGGPEALTLDAVAAEAGVSKGGLLYHFPSKDLLFVGLVEWAIAGFQERLDARLAEESGPGAYTRAYLRATFEGPPDELATAVALATVLAARPDLLEPLRAGYREWTGRIGDDGLDPVDAEIVRLASDGWWWGGLLDLSPPGKELRARLFARLMGLAGAP